MDLPLPHLRARLAAAVVALPKRTFASPAAPGRPRAARSRDAVERLLALALVASLGAAWRERAEDRGPPAPTAPLSSLPVDVARDPSSRLRLLPGLGVVRVRAILDDRARRGPVPTVGDLVRVHGLGRKTVDGLRAAGAVVVAAGPSEVADATPPHGAASARGEGGAGAGPAGEEEAR